ncbi:porin [Pseudomaricurvus sp.]|uniref:porin n=1 Tax=Pseudomaricurvus sp. TaxID=2004510 RepID=UPI003F6D9470
MTTPLHLPCLALTSTLLCALSSHVSANTYDDVWQHAKLYENSKGDYLSLSGRLQADLAYFDASEGQFDDALWRRLRFGFKGQYGQTTYHLEGDFDLNATIPDTYSRITEAYLSWKLPNKSTLKVLKHSAGFTLDGKTSSKRLLTAQRNNLTNNLWFTAEYFTGASLSGPIDDQWYFNTGLFSSDGSDEVGVSDASYFGLLSVGKKLSSSRFWDQADIRLDYVYNKTHEDQNTRDFSQVASLNSRFNWQQWGLSTDLAYGNGDMGQSDLLGVVLMPHYQQTEVVQWVARYTYIDSKDSGGIRLGRYENEIVSGRGDRYNEFYGGVNFFFYGHKAKVQLGAQYTTMENTGDSAGGDSNEYDGWGLTLALRTYW